MLDGILRDVDSITVKALQDLDPSQVNAAELVKLVTDFQAAVKFDQAAAINSSLDRQKINAERSRDLENFNSDKTNNEQILKRKSDLQKEKFDLQDKELDMAAKGQIDPTQEPLKSLKARQKLVDADLAGLTPASAPIPVQALSPGSSTAASPVTFEGTPFGKGQGLVAGEKRLVELALPQPARRKEVDQPVIDMSVIP